MADPLLSDEEKLGFFAHAAHQLGITLDIATERLNSGLTKSALTEYMKRNLESTEILVRSLNKAADLVQSFKQVAVDQSA